MGLYCLWTQAASLTLAACLALRYIRQATTGSPSIYSLKN